MIPCELGRHGRCFVIMQGCDHWKYCFDEIPRYGYPISEWEDSTFNSMNDMGFGC